MIPVPPPALEALAQLFEIKASWMYHFAGGHESSDGVVYAFPYQGTRHLLKIMAVPASEQRKGLLCLEERLKFVRFLGDHGAPIVFPEFSPQGNLYETFLFDSILWIAYSMALAPGKPQPEKSWDPRFFQNWGQTIGTMHRLAGHYPSWRSAVDPESGDTFLNWKEEWQSFYDWCGDDDVKEKWVEIRQKLDKLPIARDSFGFIHNDPHIWNVLDDGKRVTLLDFDVANHHWFVNDIAIACQNILIFHSGGMSQPVHHRDKLLEFLRLFLEGYRREHDLSPTWLNHLDLFFAYRRILLFVVMNDWIRSQPELQLTWKNMIMSVPEIVGECDLS